MVTFLSNALLAIEALQNWQKTHGYFGTLNDETLTIDLDGRCWLLPQPGKGNTPSFMAPEQTGRSQLAPDTRTDIYSLGVLFFKWLTGRMPFESKDALELTYQQVAVIAPTPLAVNPQVPEILSQIVVRMMAKDPSQRYQTLKGLRSDLQTCLDLGQAGKEWSLFELGRLDAPDHLTFPGNLYGREADLEKLSDVLVRLEQEERSLLVVGGYSGVGKSSLIRSLKGLAEARQGIYLEGKFDQFQRHQPYTAIREAFDGFVANLLTLPENQFLVWRQNLQKALGDFGQVILEILPSLEKILGPQPTAMATATQGTQSRLHYLFGRLMAAIASNETPLVLFLDDLQWVDAASLHLIKSLLINPEIQGLILLGAYRDNEVDRSHLLGLFLRECEASDLAIRQILLTDLSHEAVRQFLADTLHRSQSEVMDLAQLLYRKTSGNPFFLRQIVSGLYKDGHLQYDGSASCWKWNIAAIEAQTLSENVVDYTIARLRHLDPALQQVLAQAALIGHSFEPTVLAEITGTRLDSILDFVQLAVKESILEPSGDLEFAFGHDRLQQAASGLMEESDRDQGHLKIGHHWLKQAQVRGVPRWNLLAADHLNQVEPLITASEERIRLVRCNLDAAEQAKAASAFESGFAYTKAAEKFLPPTCWQTEIDLSLQVYLLACELSYMAGHFDELIPYVKVTTTHAPTAVVRAQANSFLALRYSNLQRLDDSLELSLQSLEDLGVVVPHHPSWEEAIQCTLELCQKLSAFDDLPDWQTYLDHPNDRFDHLTMVLQATVVPAMRGRPALGALLTAKYLDLCIQGRYLSAATPYFISWELIYFKTMMRDLQSAIRVDQIARSLCETAPFKAVWGNVLVHYTCFLQSNLEPLHATLPTFMQAYQICRDTGNTDYCGYITATYLQHALFAGTPLEEAIRTGLDLCGFYQTVDMLSQKKTTYAVLSGIQKLAASRSDHPDQWQNEFFDDRTDIPIMETGSDFLGLCFVYSTKILIAQLFRDKEAADRYFAALAPYQQSAASFYMEYWLPFARSLQVVENIAEVEADRKVVEETLVMLAQGAVHAPVNFQHKHDLLLAEKHRVSGQFSEALLAYGRAICGAEEGQFWNEAVLASELASEACLSMGLSEPVTAYLQRAVINCQRWGATAKLEDLFQRYPMHLQKESAQRGEDPTRITAADLDLESIVLASQAMALETTTDGLYRAMLDLLMKNSGADRCLLLDCVQETWRMVGHADSESPATLDALAYPEGLATLPASRKMLDFVLRTSESLIVADARLDDRFANDPHTTSNAPRSVLCLPLVQQGRIRGLLYLENHLAPSVFSPNRLRVIGVIANQFLIALENAHILEELEQRVEERTKELDEARKAAESANKAKSTFLAMMSHELRTPLNAILGFSEILRKESAPDRAHRENLQTIQRSGIHLLEIINDILDLSKIESGKLELQPQVFDLGELIADITIMLHQRAQAKGLSLELDQSSSFPRFVKSDPAKLRQILINLIGNAIKYTEQGGVRIKLCTASRFKGLDHHQIIGEVTDTGIGIAPDDLERIMEPFVQLGNHEGTGLGLTITQQIVRLMEGELRVTSTLGKGSTFQFTVGYQPVLESELPRVTQWQGEIAAITNANEFRILIVEDQLDNSRLLRSILEPFGFKIREAENGRLGLEVFREWRPHLVFLDRRMPYLDGMETAWEIRNLEVGEFRPILVAVTAHAFRDEEQEMRDAGCDDFIAKPYMKATILSSLERHLPLAVVRRPPEGFAAHFYETPTPSAVAAIPLALKTTLVEALEIGMRKSIEGWIEQIIQLDPETGGWMMEKARRLDYKPILAILDQ